MNKKDILDLAQREKRDEGEDAMENKSRRIGSLAVIFLCLCLIILNNHFGRENDSLNALLCTMAAVEFYVRFTFTKKISAGSHRHRVRHPQPGRLCHCGGVRRMNEQLILCNRLKEARASQHLSQVQLAKLVGVSRNTISSIETGQFNPTAKLALLLCIALDWKFEDLFYFTEAPEKKKRYF